MKHKEFNEFYDSRLAFDTEMMKVIDQFQPDLVVLAGFMRILSEEFVNHYISSVLEYLHYCYIVKYIMLHTSFRDSCY